MIDAAVVAGRRELPPARHSYFGFVDCSEGHPVPATKKIRRSPRGATHISRKSASQNKIATKRLRFRVLSTSIYATRRLHNESVRPR